MTSLQVYAEDQWHLATPHVNVEGVWWTCKAVYVKAEGVWHRIYKRSENVIPFPARRYLGELQDVCVSAARG
jgi:hypothetical protein